MSLGLAITAVASVASAQTPPRPRPQDVRVGVLHDGTVLLDGKADNLKDIDARLAAASKAHGMVWYYRDGSVEPTSAGDDSIHAVLD